MKSEEKISIVLEETDETSFWLEFIIDEKLLKKIEPISKMWIRVQGKASRELITERTRST
jgi:hypothetical protein